MARTFFILPLLVVVLLGWLVPLIFGIVRSRGNKGGIGCIVLGGVWGFLAICLFVLIGISWFSFSRVRKAWDPKDFDAASYEGALGRIEATPGDNATLVLQGGADGAYVRVLITNGIAAAPSGSFSIWSYELERKDESGSTWRASAQNPKGDSGKLNIPTNGVARLTLGPPFEARVTTRAQAEGNRSFDLKIAGSSSNAFTVTSSGGRSKPPGFEVVNATGVTVWSGNFAYG